MTDRKIAPLARRAALLGGLSVLPGCGLWDRWFGDSKPPLPGKREPVMAIKRALEVDKGVAQVTLPAPAPNTEWPQSGGVPSHDMEHPALPSGVTEAWSRGIGRSGGYRRKIMSQALIADGRVFTMDSAAIVTARDVAGGGEIWSFDTEDEDNRSTNVGGGIAVSGDRVYATTGRGDLVAIDAASGSMVWRQMVGTAARSSPTSSRRGAPTLS